MHNLMKHLLMVFLELIKNLKHFLNITPLFPDIYPLNNGGYKSMIYVFFLGPSYLFLLKIREFLTSYH